MVKKSFCKIKLMPAEKRNNSLSVIYSFLFDIYVMHMENALVSAEQ